jgi:hypothetical protein
MTDVHPTIMINEGKHEELMAALLAMTKVELSLLANRHGFCFTAKFVKVQTVASFAQAIVKAAQMRVDNQNAYAC